MCEKTGKRHNKYRGTQCICSLNYAFFRQNFAGQELWKKQYFPRRQVPPGKRQFRVSEGIWFVEQVLLMLFVRNLSPLTPLGHTHFLPAPPPPPPAPPTRLPGRLLGNFTVSPVAGCTEVHLAGWELFHQSCWESGTDKFFPRKLSLKCLKWLQKALFMLCCCFQVVFSNHYFPLGAPASILIIHVPKSVTRLLSMIVGQTSVY